MKDKYGVGYTFGNFSMATVIVWTVLEVLFHGSIDWTVPLGIFAGITSAVLTFFYTLTVRNERNSVS